MTLNPRQRISVALTALGCVLLALFPPWEHDYGTGYSFVLSPPPPSELSPNRPRRIDWGNLLHGEILVVLVGAAAARTLRTMPSGQEFSSFGWRTLGIAALLALVLPIPFGTIDGGAALMPPIGMSPFRDYLDRNHGIPVILWMLPLWIEATVALYVILGLGGVTAARFATRVDS
jgi:hypothetical protein